MNKGSEEILKSFLKTDQIPRPYSKEITDITSALGFNALVQYIYQNSKSGYETTAYHQAEKVHQTFFNQNRYSDYGVYKSSLHQILSRKRKKSKQI